MEIKRVHEELLVILSDSTPQPQVILDRRVVKQRNQVVT